MYHSLHIRFHAFVFSFTLIAKPGYAIKCRIVFRIVKVLFNRTIWIANSLCSKIRVTHTMCKRSYPKVDTIGSNLFAFEALLLFTLPEVLTFQVLFALPRLAERKRTFWVISSLPLKDMKSWRGLNSVYDLCHASFLSYPLLLSRDVSSVLLCCLLDEIKTAPYL